MPLQSQSLAGIWQFRPDAGTDWQPIPVPGCWEQVGFPHDWEGPGWYRCVVEIPLAWQALAKRRLWLYFGAVSYACQVWVNGAEVGRHLGAWDAFRVEITEAVGASRQAEIRVRVVKPGGSTYPTKQTTAGFLPYVWGYLHGGLWQEVALELTGPLAFSDLLSPPQTPLASPQVQADATHFLLPLKLAPQADCHLRATLLQSAGETVAQWDALPLETPSLSIPKAEISGWSADTPVCYQWRLELFRKGGCTDRQERTLGFREVTVEGNTPLLNGRPFYPRMPLSWGWYPETLHCNPPVETMQAELENIRALGYNGVKCCLWVPPPAYLDLCDRLGLLVWLELPLWLPEMDADQREHVFHEYATIVQQVRHHPSIVLWTLGCELAASCGEEFLRRLYTRVKEESGSPLVRDNSGGGECYGGLLKEYADYYDYHFYCDLPFLRTTFAYFLPHWRPEQPWFFGEFCDADAFRDLPALKAHYGGELPWWAITDSQRNPQGARWDMNILGQWANAEQHDLFARQEELKEGQRQQTLLHRKYTVELVRSYREMSGYVITGLVDTPISLAGMFDSMGAFRYTPEEFTRFNGDTVLFLGWHRRRNWVAGGDRPSYLDAWCHWGGETILPRLGISHYGDATSVQSLTWQLRSAEGQVLRAGQRQGLGSLAAGEVRQLALLEIEAPSASRMTRCVLEVEAVLAEGTTVRNEWPLWFVPKPDWQRLPAWAAYDPAHRLTGLERHGAQWEEFPAASDASLLVATRWSEEVLEFARRGGKGFIFVERGDGLPVVECPFWREAMKRFESHPLWEAFPHTGFTDLQFYGLGPDVAFDNAALQSLLSEVTLRLVLRRVDARTFAVNDYLTEAVFPSGGRLLLTTLRPHGGLGDQPDGLLRHLAGVQFLFAALESLL